MKININKQYFYSYLLACIGFCLLCYYIWFRFIRERLPQEIPFQLSIFTFLFLSMICSVYIYIIYRMFKPKAPGPFIMNIWQKVVLLFKPISVLENMLTSNKIVDNLFVNFLYHIINIFKLYHTNPNKYFYITCFIIPKAILLVVFLIDIFYFYKLHIFYYFLGLGLFPLFYNYSLYYLDKKLNLLLEDLEKYYYVKILSTQEDEDDWEAARFMVSIFDLKYVDFNVDINEFNYKMFQLLSPMYFCQIQAWNYIFDYDTYKYTCVETDEIRALYAKEHNLTLLNIRTLQPGEDDISIALMPKFFEIMPKVYKWKAFRDTYYDVTQCEQATWNKIILFGYLIGWLSILIISLYSLDTSIILEILGILNNTWCNIPENFSDNIITLFSDENK